MVRRDDDAYDAAEDFNAAGESESMAETPAALLPEQPALAPSTPDGDKPPLTDEELATALRWTWEDVAAFKNVSRGKVERGAFAQVTALKARQELAHPRLTKREDAAFAPVVILIQEPAAHAPQIRVLEAQTVDAELSPTPSPTLELASAPPPAPPRKLDSLD